MDQDMHTGRSASKHINLAALYSVVNHNVISIVHSGINNENQMSYIPYVTSGICYSYMCKNKDGKQGVHTTHNI